MEKLKMGIVGAGIWGERHASIFNSHPLVEITAICDLNVSRAQAVADKFGIKDVYSDLHEMAKKCDCDAVSIVTPDYLHAEASIAMANAKKHILIEKPLATSRKDVFAILEAVEKNNVRTMVDLHNRWSPPFHTAKQALDEGKLGKPYSGYFRLNDVKWVATDMLSWTASSSILWFLGSHSLDTLAWMFGSDVERVYCASREGIMKGHGVDTTDIYLTTLEFKNGCVAQMENAWITPNGNPCLNDIKFTLLCTEGMVNIDASTHNLIQLTTEEKVSTPDILVQHYIEGEPKGFAFESIRSFLDRLIDGKPFLVSVEEAAKGSLALLAVMESAKTRMPVKVEY
ncbi:MAG: Gfo/Idh/MocA family oxidoreductase [Oscillospiraceae bacterium]|nr:Gfo/Idh/MocA family oxidoreductase [Oscillospiraceae bacterium]